MRRSNTGDLSPVGWMNVLGGVARGVVDMIDALDRLIPEVRSAKYPVVAQVSFRDIVQYFQREQPDDFRIAAGALLRRPAAKSVILYQVFLDNRDGILLDEQGRPLGRGLRARVIDDELNHRFGGSDLIIFR